MRTWKQSAEYAADTLRGFVRSRLSPSGRVGTSAQVSMRLLTMRACLTSSSVICTTHKVYQGSSLGQVFRDVDDTYRARPQDRRDTGVGLAVRKVEVVVVRLGQDRHVVVAAGGSRSTALSKAREKKRTNAQAVLFMHGFEETSILRVGDDERVEGRAKE